MSRSSISRRSWSLPTLGLLMVAGHGQVAAAQPEPEPAPSARVLVLPAHLRGELPPDTSTQVRSLVADNLADDGLEIVVEGEVACEDDDCRREAAAGASAQYVVDAQVVGDEDEFTVTVTVFLGETGELVAPFEDACSICGFVEVRDMVRLNALDARAEIKRRTSVAMTRPVAPTPTPIAPPPPPRSKAIPIGFTFIGAGTATTIGGVVLLALHKQNGGCLDNPRGGECVPVRFTTAPAGAAVLGAGVLALAGGITMVVLGRRAQTKRLSARSGGLTLRF